MSVKQKDLDLYRGDTTVYQFLISNINPANFSVITMRIEAKRTDNNATVIGFPILSSDPGNDWANGIVQANISGGMTQGIATTETIILKYDVEVARDTGSVVTILTEWYGTIKLTPDVTVGNPVITPPTEAVIRADLGSTSDSLGAALVGVKASLWASLATNVQEALQWLYQNRLNGPSPWFANRIIKTGASSPDTLASGITIDASNNVTNVNTLSILAAPTIASHATRKDYVDASAVAYLDSLAPLAGEVLTFDGAYYDFQIQADGVQTVNGIGGANPVLKTIDIIENTNLYYTEDRVDDRVASLLQAGTNITLTYNDPAGTLTIDAAGGGGGVNRGYISGGLSFNSTSLPPTITAGNYEVNGALVDFNADQTLALTDTLLQSRQALENHAQYLVCMDNTGVKKYILYGEGAIASATGNITSITGAGTTKTITAATGTFPANSFTRGGILVISGNNGVNGVFKVASYTSGTVVTFESVATVTGTGSGTWTLYDRINTLHGVGSATAIIVDADVVKYTPSLGENGWPAGIAAWSDILNGYYITLTGLTGYRVIGSFNTGAAGVVSKNVFSYKTGRNKNDNDWLVSNPTSQTGVTDAIRGCTIARMTGCDYIYVDNGTVGTEFTLQRYCHASASYSTYSNSYNIISSILASFTTTNTFSYTSVDQQGIFGYAATSNYGANIGIARLLNRTAIIKPLTQGISTGASEGIAFSGSLTL